VKDKLIHVFTREFAELALSELDTVSDFCDYLRKKEAIDRNQRVVIAGGEENLLAARQSPNPPSIRLTKPTFLVVLRNPAAPLI
jgi:hypothetical protein